MKVLIVKTSSLGDVIHTLPAVSDALSSGAKIRFDWVVERAFADIPALHPRVDNVIPLELRRWRKQPLASRAAFSAFRELLNGSRYDLVLDAQGLIKSAFVARLADGPIAGFGWGSAREPLASLAYHRTFEVDRNLHAVERVRRLFALALGYPLSSVNADFGISGSGAGSGSQILLLHGTTWATKHWPEAYWQSLAARIASEGFVPLIPAGNDEERRRAGRIAAESGGEVLDRLPLGELANRFAGCRGAVSVDTGLGHLAAALGIPLVSLFGPTDPALTGMVGGRASALQDDGLDCIPCLGRQCVYDQSHSPWPPCMGRLTPDAVWHALADQMA